jgi:peptidoglycan/xylan/chitin deacetylase (PgdA/CDA1 family)
LSILCYHSIDKDWQSNLAIPPSSFAQHCAWLRRHRRVIDLQEAVTRLSDWRLPRGFTALTFDDGFSDFHACALPILARLGLPATVFLVAERLLSPSRPIDWVDDPPPWPLQTLSRDEILQMQDAGVVFGSHALSHCDLTLLGDDECESKLRASRELLEDVLGTAVNWLAYPRGRHNLRVRHAAERAGFSHAFAMYGGGQPAGRYAIPRAGIFRRNKLVALRIKTSRWYLDVRANNRVDSLIDFTHRNRGRRSLSTSNHPLGD